MSSIKFVLIKRKNKCGCTERNTRDECAQWDDHVKKKQELTIYKPRSEPSQKNQSLILDLQPP